MKLIASLLITAALLGGGVVATADAATVAVRSVVGQCYYKANCDPSYTELAFTAAGGETNDLRVTAVSDAVWSFHDAGAPVTAGERCTAIDAHTAHCPVPLAPGGPSVRSVSLGDGDDLLVTEVGLFADGGAGADQLRAGADGATLAGGPGTDVLTGGDANDGLRGGPDPDVLRGGAGDDQLAGDAGDDIASVTTQPIPADDVLDGGPGADTVQYGGALAATVDLSVPRAGRSTEVDELTGIENARGTAGADVLIGDDGPNALTGDLGADDIRGAGGDDRLQSFGGGAKLDGGLGDDLLDTGFLTDNRAVCGDGIDRVKAGELRRFGADCELYAADQLHLGSEDIAMRPVGRTARTLTFRFACRTEVSADACSQPFKVETAARLGRCGRARCRVVLVQRSAVKLARGEARDVTFGLTKAGRALLRRSLGLKVRISPAAGGWTTTLS